MVLDLKSTLSTLSTVLLDLNSISPNLKTVVLDLGGAGFEVNFFQFENPSKFENSGAGFTFNLVKFENGAAGFKFNLVKFENSGAGLNSISSNLKTLVQWCWV